MVAGDGPPALEALLALSRLGGDRIALTLVAGAHELEYRPLSTVRPFAYEHAGRVELAALAAGCGAELVASAVEYVEAPERRLLTRDGDFVGYDLLLVAVEPQQVEAVPGAETWLGGVHRAVRFGEILRALADGSRSTFELVVPQGAGWPADAYELALIAAAAAPAARVTLTSAEDAPLAALGPAASALVAHLLVRGGVEFRDRSANSAGDAERVVALPRALGPAVGGLPHDGTGFVPIDERCRVPGLADVWACGPGTAVMPKNAAVSARQAETAAAAMAEAAGVGPPPAPWEPRLHGLVCEPQLDAAQLLPAPGEEAQTHCLWWPPGELAGADLVRRLARHDHRVRAGLDWHPRGLPVDVPLTVGSEVAFHPPEDRHALDELLDRYAVDSELRAVDRREAELDATTRAMERELQAVDAHRRDVVSRVERLYASADRQRR